MRPKCLELTRRSYPAPKLSIDSSVKTSCHAKIKARACKIGGDALIGIRVTEVRRLEFAMFNVSATVVRFAQTRQD
jgi:hypothetical protein